MTCFICSNCGTQFAEAKSPPSYCPICVDDRQYVNWQGQQWTDLPALQKNFAIRWECEPGGIPGIGMAPSFAIPQRALLLQTPNGNILWECISLVNDDVVDKIAARGGVECIAISHPHFFASMVAWSEALGDVPIVIHERNRDWVMRPDRRIEFFSGKKMTLLPGLDCYHAGGHFEGSTFVHWPDWNCGEGALLAADTLHVSSDQHSVSFMHSVPNYIPLPPSDVRRIFSIIRDLHFANVYGFTWGRNIIGNGREIVEASVNRYLLAIGAEPVSTIKFADVLSTVHHSNACNFG